MKYKIKIQEIDDATNYPVQVLSGLTGLGQDTLRKLAEEGNFSINQQDGETVVNGSEFRRWSASVDDTIEVQS